MKNHEFRNISDLIESEYCAGYLKDIHNYTLKNKKEAGFSVFRKRESFEFINEYLCHGPTHGDECSVGSDDAILWNCSYWRVLKLHTHWKGKLLVPSYHDVYTVYTCGLESAVVNVVHNAKQGVVLPADKKFLFLFLWDTFGERNDKSKSKYEAEVKILKEKEEIDYLEVLKSYFKEALGINANYFSLNKNGNCYKIDKSEEFNRFVNARPSD